MDLRKDLGGQLEEVLNKLVDEHLSAAALMPLVEGLINGQVGKIKEQIKKNMIDKIDGEVDYVPPVPSEV